MGVKIVKQVDGSTKKRAFFHDQTVKSADYI